MHVRKPSPLVVAILVIAMMVGVTPASAATPSTLDRGGWENATFSDNPDGVDLGDGGFTSPSFLRTNGTGTLTATWTGLGEHTAVDLDLHVAQLESLDPIRDGDRLSMFVDGQPLLAVGLGFGVVPPDEEPLVHDLELFGQDADEALVDAVRTLTIDKKKYPDHVYDFGALEALQAIPHTGDTLTLTITGIGGQGWDNEAYAIDNLDLTIVDNEDGEEEEDGTVPEPPAAIEEWPTQEGVLAAGERHTCGITDSGTARCWGYAYGNPPAGVTFTALTASDRHTCGITDSGTARCWGYNSGNPPAGVTFTALAAGDRHACGITDSGTTRCWGTDTSGSTTPPAGVTFTALAAGDRHTCGITDSGSTRCWGYNYRGTTNPPAGVTFTALAAGDFHTCGITDSGTTRCWGYVLGTPPAGVTFTALAAGDRHTCGITDSGTARCWGYAYGNPPAGVKFTALAAGDRRTCGITDSGTARCWGTDTSGSTTPPAGVTFGADLFAPEIASSLDGDANAAGWYSRPVTVSYACADNFGEVDCPQAVTVDADGADQQVTGTAADPAGHTASITDVISLDQTAPTLTTSPDSPANQAGWHNRPVTLTHGCADALSGIHKCSAPTTVETDGTTTVSGHAVDLADNVTENETTVRIDQVDPTIEPSRDVEANEAGWANQPVTVRFGCDDDRSGVTLCSAPTTVEEGATTVDGIVIDVAGNRATSSMDVAVDLTAPTLTTSPDSPANQAGWHNRPVTLTHGCADALSGIHKCSAPTTVETDGTTTVSGHAVDLADNVTENETTVRIDQVDPTIEPSRDVEANEAGWANQPVTVAFDCDDDRSGIADCTSATEVGEGIAIVDGFAVDVADNLTFVSVDVAVDLTAPTLTTSLDAEAGESGWHTQPVTLTHDCDDALSGIATCSQPSTVDVDGTTTVTGTAIDLADNTTKDETTILLDTEAATSTYNGTALGFGLGIAPTGSLSGAVTDATSGVAELAVILTPTQGGDAVVATAELDCSTATPTAPGGMISADGAVDGLTVADDAPTSCAWTLQDAPQGSWQLHTSATDIAGNIEEPVDHGTVIIS